jgi:hypothetical protein
VILKKQVLSLALKYAGKAFFLLFLLTFFAGKAYAVLTFTWKGSAGNTTWENATNWTQSGSGGTSTWPGQHENTDIVQIGTTTYTISQPTLSTPYTVASITFGGNGGNAMTLTINGVTLAVTNGVIQNHNSNPNTGSIASTISGTGTLTCGSFSVGDTNTPGTGSGNTNTFTTIVTCSISTLTVNGTLNLNSNNSAARSAGHHDMYNPTFTLSSGTLNVSNITITATNFASGNASAFKMGINTTANTLNISGSITVPAGIGGTVSFLSAATNALTSTVNYTGAGQTVYTTADAFLTSTPTNYGNLSFSNSGIKTLDAGAPTVGGNLLNNVGSTLNGNATAETATINGSFTNNGTLNVNNDSWTFTGAVTNSGSYLPGTGNGTSTFLNGLTNSGTFTGGTGIVTITAGTLTNNSPGIVNGGAGTMTIATLTNNTGGNINGNATAGAITVTGALTNAGTVTVNNGTMTFTGLATNTGTYTGGAGTSTFTTGLTNSSAVTEDAGQFTIGNLVNNSPGTFTGDNTVAATTSVTGTLTNSGTITVNKENITFGGDATNTGTYTGGTGTSTFSNSFSNNAGSFTAGIGIVTLSGDYTNGATFTANATGNVIFGGASAQALADNSTNGTTFTNVTFQGGGTKTLAGNKGFFVSSTGILTMAGTTTLAAAGLLTLNSDANSSATVAAIPSGCAITGNVNVQRFIKGSSDLTKRGYRLLSSSVYTGTVGTVNMYDLNYLTKSVHLSGPGYAANGFDVTSTANPSIYLFREDVPPPPTGTTAFTTGYNWKGVAKINDNPLYKIGTQAKTTTTNVFDASYNLPVGNGILFFFRGDISQAVTSPPMDVTLTQTGTLNTGTIQTNIWFAADDALPANTFSWTNPTSNPAYSASADLLTAGYALVGNPYASTINWEKFNTTALPGTIPSTIWMFNALSKQYEAYIPLANDPDITTEFTSTYIGPGGGTGTGAASNFIASGQGFFIKASAAGQTLKFTENAKISAQPTASNLNELMGKPVQFAAVPRPMLRLKMALDSVNADDIVIVLDNKASTKLADGEDAEDLGGSGSLLGLSSFSSDSIKLAINTLPYPDVKPQIIRILANAASTGTYTFTVPLLKNLPALYQVWLKDAFTADSLQLKTNASYEFTIDKSNTATFGGTRFTVVIRQDTAMAYKLLSFTATKADHKKEVQLDWETANEANYTNFTVERSTDDGKTFDVIGGLQGTGAGNYSLLDKKPGDGENFYRLKQEDINNTITYSNVVEVQFGDRFADKKLHIFPNPATHTINLAIADQGNDKGVYSIRFMNSSGKVIKQVNSSEPEWQGNISYLQPGTYLVRVINNKTQNLVGENKFVKL